MTEAEVRTEIERLVAHDFPPVLEPGDIDALVEIAKTPDAAGREPDDAEWEETWNMTAALASGWETKAARCAGDFRFEEDNQAFYREQAYRHCRQQADRYNKGMVPVEVVAYQGTA